MDKIEHTYTVYDVLTHIRKAELVLEELKKQALKADLIPLHIAQRIHALDAAEGELLALRRKWEEGGHALVDRRFDGPKPEKK